MNVVLISPPEKHILVEAGDRPYMSLLYLAASLRSKGHKVLISDLNHDSYKVLFEKLRGADFAGITTFTPYYEWTINFAEHLKQNFPKLKLIAGGPHATVAPESLEPYFEYIVIGEGEKAIIDIVEGRCDIGHHIKIKDEFKSKIKFTGIHTQITCDYEEDLDKLPCPVDELEYGKYGLNQEGNQTITILTSRSCNYNCFFCTKGILGPKRRVHSIERVIYEIKKLKEKGFSSFYFLDDCFTTDMERAGKIADKLKPLNVTYRITSRSDSINDKLMKKLKESGCRSISFGFEHIDDNVLKKINKGETVVMHQKAVDIAKKYNIKIRGSFIINLPGATEKTIYTTIDWAIKNKLDYADFYPLIAYPKTPLWEHPEIFGVVVFKDMNVYQTSTKTNVLTNDLSLEKTSLLVRHARERWKEFKGLKCPWEIGRENE